MTPGERAFLAYYTFRAKAGRTPRVFGYNKLGDQSQAAWDNVAKEITKDVIRQLTNRLVPDVVIPIYNGYKDSISKQRTRDVLLEQEKKQ